MLRGNKSFIDHRQQRFDSRRALYNTSSRRRWNKEKRIFFAFVPTTNQPQLSNSIDGRWTKGIYSAKNRSMAESNELGGMIGKRGRDLMAAAHSLLSTFTLIRIISGVELCSNFFIWDSTADWAQRNDNLMLVKNYFFKSHRTHMTPIWTQKKRIKIFHFLYWKIIVISSYNLRQKQIGIVCWTIEWEQKKRWVAEEMLI